MVHCVTHYKVTPCHDLLVEVLKNPEIRIKSSSSLSSTFTTLLTSSKVLSPKNR